MKIKKFIIILILMLLVGFPYNVFAQQDKVTLSKCVDGDTARFLINGKEYVTRFLAIDTPETKHPKKKKEPYGQEASDYTCKRLTEAKTIILEYDNNSTKEDKYGRKLAWVFVDNSLLQKELIEKGYAKTAYLYDDYKYTKSLQVEEEKSKNKKIGIWSTNKSTAYQSQSISIQEIFNKIWRYIRKEIKSML